MLVPFFLTPSLLLHSIGLFILVYVSSSWALVKRTFACDDQFFPTMINSFIYVLCSCDQLFLLNSEHFHKLHHGMLYIATLRIMILLDDHYFQNVILLCVNAFTSKNF